MRVRKMPSLLSPLKKPPAFILAHFQERGNCSEVSPSGEIRVKTLLIRRRTLVPDIENAQRVFFNQIGNLLINRGIIVHLFFQGLVLGADIPEKSGGITQKFGGEVGI